MNTKFLENRPLFKECLEALNVDLLPDEEANKLSALFKKEFPITTWGKIDWVKIDKKIDLGYDPDNIIPALEQLLQGPIDKSVYIEWSTGGIPVIKTNLDDIIKFLDDVTCVAFEKFIFNLDQGYIIEILPGNKTTVGLINK